MYKKEAESFWGLLFEKSFSKRYEQDFSLKEKKRNLYFTLLYTVYFHAPCKVVKLLHDEIIKDPTSLAFPLSPLSMAGPTDIPPVERSIAIHLCQNTTSTWRSKPCLPSQACKHLSSLTGTAYAACGVNLTSILHAMELLQVRQDKALKVLHEGGDPVVLKELQTATDFVL